MKDRNAQIILGILYTVGVFGYLSSYSTQFANLTCLNLLISLFAVLYYQPIKDAKFYFVCFSIYLISFCTELIGVNTGLIFGNYSYGDVLGIEFLKFRKKLVVQPHLVAANRTPVRRVKS